MKMLKMLVAMLLVSYSVAESQSYIDAIRFNQNSIEGTARSQAMGSAFGALGADLSSITINPAGLGAYRTASEFSFSMGVSSNDVDTKYYGYSRSKNKISVPLMHLGLVFHWGDEVEDEYNGLSHSFAISYSQLANYNSDAVYSDFNGYNSILDDMTNDYCIDNYGDDYYGGMAYEAGYIKEQGSDVYNIWEKLYESNPGEFLYDMDMREGVDEYGGYGLIDHRRYVKERGTKGEVNFAYGINIQNVFQLGVSLNAVTLDYTEKMAHYEDYYGDTEYAKSLIYGTELHQDGSGINMKIGAIYRPINEIRIGFALHTPTAFNIKERYTAYMQKEYNDYYYDAPRSKYEYRYRSPGRIVASIAGVIGQYGIISFDYDRSNWGNSKFKERERDINDGFYDGFYDEINDENKLALQAVNTFRFGLEARPINFISLRAGYKMSSSPLKKVAYCDYDMKSSAISCGIGARFNYFYLDFAYVRNNSEKEYWVLPDGEYMYEENCPAKYSSVNNNFVLTAGFKF